MENMGLSCMSNLLLGSMYTIAFILYRIISFYYPLNNNNNTGTIRYMLGTPPLPPSPPDRQNNNETEDHVLLITPPMLWYYVYSIGLGIFCLSYTIHGSNLASTICLCGSSMVCALSRVYYEHHDPQKPILKLVPLIILISILDASSVILCVFFAMEEEEPFWRNWVSEFLGPLLTPWAIAECRVKLKAIQVSSDQVLLFALPFVGVLSTGFLSMYIPMQECMIISPNHLVAVMHSNEKNDNVTAQQYDSYGGVEWAALLKEWFTLGGGYYYYDNDKKNNSMGAVMPLLAAKTIQEQSFLALGLSVVLVPAVLYVALLLYLGAFHKAENLLVSSHGLWLVVASKQGILEQHGGEKPIIITALLSWMLCMLYLLVYVYQSEKVYHSWEHVEEEAELSSLGQGC